MKINKIILLFLIGLFSFNSFAIEVECSPLSFGSFLLKKGLDSTSDDGPSRIGLNLIGNKAECEITGVGNQNIQVTINENSSNIALNGDGGTFNANIWLESTASENHGTSHGYSIPNEQTKAYFNIDASVPQGQSTEGGGTYSTSVIVNISLN